MLLIVLFALLSRRTEANLTEMSGFHCKHWNSMRLDRQLHGKPHETTPPFEFSLIDDNGNAVEQYTPGETYKMRLVGYIHFRGFMIQSRLCTPEGYLIGSLRGGRFIIGNNGDIFGIQYQKCDDSDSNDALTHSDSNKKFLLEVQWTAERDVGAVQFMLTVATEDELYWERWRPRNGFIRPTTGKEQKVLESLFEIEVQPGSEFEPTITPEELATGLPLEDASTPEPFDPEIFERIENAEEGESSRVKSIESLVALHGAFMPIEIMSSFSPTTPQPTTLAAVPDSSAASETTVGPTEVPAALTTAEPLSIEDITANGTSRKNITEAPRRLFKKYSPSREVVLNDDDLKFLNSHAQLRHHDFVDDNEMEIEETCRQANPCEHGGTCRVLDGKVHCECTEGFTGDNCAEVDMCVNNACAKNSTCRNGPKGTYICDCKENTVGTYCEFTCPQDQCFGNGVCIMRHDGRIGCTCNPGMTGRRCEKEINECEQKHCQNAVECIDKFNDYECVCEEGWFGKDCDRPCQDVYGSCRIWKREGQCEIPRESTEFFEVNCPVSCEKCLPRNDTNTEFADRLPAILLPLSWILGVWKAEVKGFNGRSFDFPLDFNSSSYVETVTFTVSRPIMFGTPSINFTTEAVNKEDPTDVHLQNGFLTIRQYPPFDKVKNVALTSVSNQGITIIEEGTLTKTEGTSGPILNFTPVYTKINDNLRNSIPKKITRSFVRKGNRLIETIAKETNGRKIKFKKVYDRIREIEFI